MTDITAVRSGNIWPDIPITLISKYENVLLILSDGPNEKVKITLIGNAIKIIAIAVQAKDKANAEFFFNQIIFLSLLYAFILILTY